MVTLPPLPYSEGALEPVISANTLRFHHGKHHKAYVDKLNELVKGSAHESAPLEQVILATAGKPASAQVFNNAAQVWNHTFFWSCLKGKGGGKPGGKVGQRIDADFGGFESFRKQFAEACDSQFGSGWGWLVLDNDKLKVVKTADAEVPFTKGQVPLLTIDVWEHAYYLDYQNRRPDYVNAVIDKLLNWSFAEENLAQSPARAEQGFARV